MKTPTLTIAALVLAIALSGCHQQSSPALTPAASTSAVSETVAAEPTRAPEEIRASKFDDDQAIFAAMQSRYEENTKRVGKFYPKQGAMQLGLNDLNRLDGFELLYENGSPDERAFAQKAVAMRPKLQQQMRLIYASSLEEAFVKSGMDVRVQATGKTGTDLKLTYALMSRPLVYKLQNEWQLESTAGKIGFKRAVYATGRGDGWTSEIS